VLLYISVYYHIAFLFRFLYKDGSGIISVTLLTVMDAGDINFISNLEDTAFVINLEAHKLNKARSECCILSDQTENYIRDSEVCIAIVYVSVTGCAYGLFPLSHYWQFHSGVIFRVNCSNTLVE